MAQFRNPALRQLTEQQVRYAPRDVRIQQVARAEQFLATLDEGVEYSYQHLCHELTNFRSDLYPSLSISGKDAAHDVRLFVERLSDSADIPVDSLPERVLTVEDVSREFQVSTKTVDRWRDRGLVSRRLVFGKRKRIGFLQSSVDRFVARHAADVARGSRFSHLDDAEREQIVSRARRLARAGACPSEVSRRIARKLGRSPETIRYTLKQFDEQNPHAAIFPENTSPLSEPLKKDLFDAFRQGTPVEELARRHNRTTTSIYRIVSEMRARKLFDRPIDFIYHPSFEALDADDVILAPPPPPAARTGVVKPPPGLPSYLNGLYSIPLLSREEEVYYFRKMNYLKFKAARLRDQLDVVRARSKVIDEIESYLDQATEVKNHLTRSNLRLVVSIAKRHLKPGGNFFEMVSDGNMSLIRAAEKFDFGKGFKFSTYATWAIMKNFARTIPAEHTLLDRYRPVNDEFFLASVDRRSDAFEQELVNARQHQAIMRIINRLEERERNILLYRFGLVQGSEPQTLEQLGAKFGVTKERIRQLEARALEKARKIAIEEHLDIPGL
jgi:RNA polymerase sigma factor (sigma-70 family)